MHKQRGGEWTVASIQDTLRYLWSQASGKASQVQSGMRDTLDHAARVTEPGGRAGVADTAGPRTYGDHSGRKDDTGRY
ncbi:MAG TPA: hypothetical protein VFK02_33845 [Kofleriaceae bacterium]|nr:hypothetical protein [Kofleriaceae bacterium]